MYRLPYNIRQNGEIIIKNTIKYRLIFVCFQDFHSVQYQQFQAIKSTSATKRSADVDESHTSKKQLTIDDHINQNQAKKITQLEFEQDVVSMLVVDDMESLSVGQRFGFSRFCAKYIPKYKLPSRRTVGRRLVDLYEEKKQSLLEKLKDVKWTSLTADTWSAHRKSFMGVTLHYVEPRTLQMMSYALACRRFKGSHTAKAICMLLNEIIIEFKLTNKVEHVVTDNAANFVKAFTLFQQDIRPTNDEGSEDEDRNDNDIIVTGSIDDSFNYSVEIANDMEDHEDFPVLPSHIRCGNHTLNLVASSDAVKARRDKVYMRNYDRAMGKVKALSNALSRSPQMNEIFEESTSKTFIQSCTTRWWSEFNSVERVVEIGLEKVVESQQKMGLTPMTQNDFKFLESFLAVMKPIIVAMKMLEGETNTYIGQVIPTVMGLERKFKTCTDALVKPLALAMLEGLDLRFGPVKEKREYVLATMLHPKFKLNFIKEDQRLKYREMLEEYVKEINQLVATSTTATRSASNTSIEEDAEDLYGFLTSRQSSDTEITDQVCHCM